MTAEDPFRQVTLDRLRSLEKQISILRWLLVLLIVLLIWRAFVYQPTVRAERFELIDAQGRQRGMWRVREGRPAFILQDTDGIWRAILTAGAEESSLRVVGAGMSAVDAIAGPGTAALRVSHADEDVGLGTMSTDSSGARL